MSPRSDLAQTEKDREKELHHSLDQECYTRVNQQILTHIGEQGVRAILQNYTQHILDITTGEAEYPDEARKKVRLIYFFFFECSYLIISYSWRLKAISNAATHGGKRSPLRPTKRRCGSGAIRVRSRTLT